MLFLKEANKQEGLFRKTEAHLVTESCMQCLLQSKVLSLFIFLSKSRQTRLLVGWTCLSAVIVTMQANVGLETLRDLQLMLVSDMTLLRSLNSLVPDSGPRHFPLSLAHWSLRSSCVWVFILTWGVEEQDPDVVVVVWLWFVWGGVELQMSVQCERSNLYEIEQSGIKFCFEGQPSALHP